MHEEAVIAGHYHSPGWNKDYSKTQILTVEDILNGKQPDLRQNLDTFKKAQKLVAETDDQQTLAFLVQNSFEVK